MKIRFIVVSIIIICLLSSFAFAQDIGDLNLNQYFDSLSIDTTSSQKPVDLDAVIRVQLNGKIINFTDSNGNVANPKIINNRTMVPMRKIFELFKASVSWTEETQTVVATTEAKEITLTIGSETAIIKDLKTNEETKMTLDQAPVIRENRTLVPVRFIAEGLDKTVGWDGDQRAVIIIDESALADELKSKVPALEKLFALNIGEMGSYASTSDVYGFLSYIDTDSKVNEKISISGTANIEVDLLENMEADINLTTTGTDGQIMAALKQQNYDNFDAKIILKDGKVYVGLKENDDYTWTDASESINSVDVPSTPNTLSKITNYAETIALIESYVGELNLKSYENIESIISMLGLFINDDTLMIKEDGFVLDLDFVSIYEQMGSPEAELPISELGLRIDVKLDQDVITNERLEFRLNVNSIESAEDLDLKIGIDTEYKILNGGSIEAPKM